MKARDYNKLAIKTRKEVIEDLNNNGASYPMNKLLISKFRTPDGTVLISKHTHDYVTHFDTVDQSLFGLDGGISYQKITGDLSKLVNLSVYSIDPHEKIRDNFTWGSYGKNGDEELHYILLKELTDDHISAIIRTQKHLAEHITKVFNDELTYRSNEQ